jgi:hypothetical protein
LAFSEKTELPGHNIDGEKAEHSRSVAVSFWFQAPEERVTRFVVTFRGCTHVVMAPSRAAAMKVVRELHGMG